jgi:hypothetical protein
LYVALGRLIVFFLVLNEDWSACGGVFGVLFFLVVRGILLHEVEQTLGQGTASKFSPFHFPSWPL